MRKRAVTAHRLIPELDKTTSRGSSQSLTTCRLNRFSQLLQETEHSAGGEQRKVAKIVPYGPPFTFNNLPDFFVGGLV
jgi:hypothetical protein